MATSSNTPVVDLDFDNIKNNLKNYLQQQSYFTDYDFEGSGLNILLDLLAYDTHYKAYLANMVINERFLDTAVKRASVVSHAKSLGYVPHSYTSAKAKVDISVYGNTVSGTMTLDRFTSFSSIVGGQKYTFVNLEPYKATPSGDMGAYVFSGVDLYEGTPLQYSWVISDPSASLKIPAPTVDCNSVQVIVQESSTSTKSEIFYLADNISSLDSSSNVYFIEEGIDGYFYIYFGDGIIGKKVSVGNIVILNYLSSNGDLANVGQNNSQTFTLVDTIGGYDFNNVFIDVLENSNGGATKESVSSIRYNAMKKPVTRNSAVTPTDYENLIKNNFNTIESVYAWGGEDNIPPIHSKVFIAMKPKNGYVVSAYTKSAIEDYLKSVSLVGVIPELIDPDFIFVGISCNVKYDYRITTRNSSDIETMVKNTITQYFNTEMEKFNKSFYYSKLGTLIDSIDPAILGSDIQMTLQKRIEPMFGVSSAYNINYSNSILPYTISSSAFNIVGTDGKYQVVQIKDITASNPPDANGTGTLQLVRLSDSKVLVENIGTVNYKTGNLVISALTVYSYPDNNLVDIRINASVKNTVNDLSVNSTTANTGNTATAMKNQIIMLDDSVAVFGYGLNNGLAVTATPL